MENINHDDLTVLQIENPKPGEYKEPPPISSSTMQIQKIDKDSVLYRYIGAFRKPKSLQHKVFYITRRVLTNSSSMQISRKQSKLVNLFSHNISYEKQQELPIL